MIQKVKVSQTSGASTTVESVKGSQNWLDNGPHPEPHLIEKENASATKQQSKIISEVNAGTTIGTTSPV